MFMSKDRDQQIVVPAAEEEAFRTVAVVWVRLGTLAGNLPVACQKQPAAKYDRQTCGNSGEEGAANLHGTSCASTMEHPC